MGDTIDTIDIVDINMDIEDVLLTEELGEPLRLVVMLHGDGAGVEEDEHDHEPEPGGGLHQPIRDQHCEILTNHSSPCTTSL